MISPVVILAGGQSRRMGLHKALLPFGPGRLIDHVAGRIGPQADSIFVNANDPAIALAGAASFADVFDGHLGPLAGIHAGLAHVAAMATTATHVLMLPVDVPFFPANLAARLAAALAGPEDFALSASLGRLHPVIGLWPISVLPALSDWLSAPPTLKVQDFLAGRAVRSVDFELTTTRLGSMDPFFNVNDQRDLSYALMMLETLSQ